MPCRCALPCRMCAALPCARPRCPAALPCCSAARAALLLCAALLLLHLTAYCRSAPRYRFVCSQASHLLPCCSFSHCAPNCRRCYFLVLRLDLVPVMATITVLEVDGFPLEFESWLERLDLSGAVSSVAPAVVGQSAPAVTAVVPAGQPSCPPSPDRRSSRPHSPAPRQERKSSRRRRESPRRYQQQSRWPAHPGGQGDWRGSRARGGGGGHCPPVTMADLQREVSRAVREERAAQSQSSSVRALPAREAPRPAAPPPNPQPVAAPPPQIQALPAPSPAVSAPASGSRLQLPPVPPVAGVEFVAAGGGSLAAPFALPADADEPLQFLAEALQPSQTCVPEATLGQLHRLADSLHALLLIQALAHSSFPVIHPETFRGRQRDSCLDAADQLAVLPAPVLAAPVEGGAAAAGQLDKAVRGLRRHLRGGYGAVAIGASTLVVRELWRSLTGILHALGAHRM
ncbi:unnamed protein product [Closterium sp. NIES-54]